MGTNANQSTLGHSGGPSHILGHRRYLARPSRSCGLTSRAKNPRSYWVLMGQMSAAILAFTWTALTLPVPVSH